MSAAQVLVVLLVERRELRHVLTGVDMEAVELLLPLAWRDVRVALEHLQAGVAELFHAQPIGDPLLAHEGGARVAQHVRRNVNAGLRCNERTEAPDRLLADRCIAYRAGEHVRRRELALFAHYKIRRHRNDGPRRHAAPARFAATRPLPPLDANRAGAEIHI